MTADDARAALGLAAAALELRGKYDEVTRWLERITVQRDRLVIELEAVRAQRNELEAILRRLVAGLDVDVQLAQEVDRCVALELDPLDPQASGLVDRLQAHQVGVSAARAEARRAIGGAK